MRTFRDNDGREWTVAINVGSMKRIRDMAGVDVFGGGLPAFVEDVTANPVMLADVLYAVIQPQAEKREVTPELFAEAVAGDVIEHAADALLSELVDFFPKARREILKKILETSKEVEAEQFRRLAETVESPEFRKTVEGSMADGSSSASVSPE